MYECVGVGTVPCDGPSVPGIGSRPNMTLTRIKQLLKMNEWHLDNGIKWQEIRQLYLILGCHFRFGPKVAHL